MLAATAALFRKRLQSLAHKARTADIAAADMHAVGVGEQPRRLGWRHGWTLLREKEHVAGVYELGVSLLLPARFQFLSFRHLP